MRTLCLLAALVLSCGGGGSAPDAAKLTYFVADLPQQFKDCSGPTCTKKIGEQSWTLTRKDLKGNASATVPSVASTNQFLAGVPSVHLVAADARTDAPLMSELVSAARIEAGSTLDEYETSDVPCVTQGTCKTTAIVIGGKLVSSTYTICLSTRDESRFSVTADQIRAVFDHQVTRLGDQGTYVEVAEGRGRQANGTYFPAVATTKGRVGKEALAAVHVNIALRDDVTNGCVNTMFVLRTSTTDALFETYQRLTNAKANADQADKNATVPH